MSISRLARKAAVDASSHSYESNSDVPVSPLRLGVLADSSLHINRLVALLKQTHHSIICTAQAGKDSLPLREDVDAWVVCIQDYSESADQIMQWLHERDVPIIIEETIPNKVEGSGRTPQWLEARIHTCVAAYMNVNSIKPSPKSIWVLAASTGGPEAVATFLSELGEETHNSAFVYAQHIDQSLLASVITMLKSRSKLDVRVCTTDQTIESGAIYLVSPDHEFEIEGNLRIKLTGKKWKGIYTPSINQVVAKVARAYREKSGVIFFSGMGDDGAESVRLMHLAGGLIYTQSLASCTIDSMPKSIHETGCVNFCGSVSELSKKISRLCVKLR